MSTFFYESSRWLEGMHRWTMKWKPTNPALGTWLLVESNSRKPCLCFCFLFWRRGSSGLWGLLWNIQGSWNCPNFYGKVLWDLCRGLFNCWPKTCIIFFFGRQDLYHLKAHGWQSVFFFFLSNIRVRNKIQEIIEL